MLDLRWRVIASWFDDILTPVSASPVPLNTEDPEQLAVCRSWLDTLVHEG